MPTYEYQCPKCGHEFAKRLRMSQYKDPQSCPECGHSPADKLVSKPNFILKGDDWAGKNIRINRQMAEKNRRLKAKEEERKRDATVRLAPNVDGERVDTWSEAKKLAESRGKDTTGYEKMEREAKQLQKKTSS